MIAICIKNIDTLFFEYSVGSKYQIRKIYKSKDLIFDIEETNYEIIDNYGEIHNLKDLNKHVFLMHGSIVKNKMEFTNSLTKIVFPIYEIPYKLLTEDFLAIKELILLGDGIGFLPKYLLNMDEKEKNNLLPIFTDYHLSNTGAYSFVYPAQNKVSIKVKTFIETALAFVD